MKILRASLFVFVGLAMSGCAGPGTQQIFGSIGSGLSAEKPPAGAKGCGSGKNIFFAQPLCDGYNDLTVATVTSDKKVDFVGAALRDSRRKCQNFISQFTGLQAGENTGLDVLSLTLSGLASVLTPVSTVRGLAAASTAVQGTKQAINADLFQQLTVSLFVQQINTSYYQRLDAEFPDSAFPHTDSELKNYSVAVQLAKIEAIHRNCSIPFSAANISTVEAKAAAPVAVGVAPDTMITISGKITAEDVITLTAKSDKDGMLRSLPYTVKSGDTVARVAKGLMALIHDDLKLAQANVAGFPEDPADNDPKGSSAQFRIHGGPADMSWTYAASGPGNAAASETLTISGPSGTSTQ